jgi:uncharacterized protein YjiS (DUF1127 family)
MRAAVLKENLHLDVAHPSLWRGRAAALAAWAGRVAARRWERQCRRRAVRELARFDERMLADIGIERSAIPAVVDRLLRGPRPPR